MCLSCQQMVNIAERNRGKLRTNENNSILEKEQYKCNSEQLIATVENSGQPYFPNCKSVGAAYGGSNPPSPTRIKEAGQDIFPDLLGLLDGA